MNDNNYLQFLDSESMKILNDYEQQISINNKTHLPPKAINENSLNFISNSSNVNSDIIPKNEISLLNRNSDTEYPIINDTLFIKSANNHQVEGYDINNLLLKETEPSEKKAESQEQTTQKQSNLQRNILLEKHQNYIYKEVPYLYKTQNVAEQYIIDLYNRKVPKQVITKKPVELKTVNIPEIDEKKELKTKMY